MTKITKLVSINKKIITFLLLNVSIIAGVPILRATTSEVIINEVAWMGTATSTADEWIELYNNTSNDISLAGWTLTANDGTPNISLNGTVASHSYFLLERTDDTSVPNILADLIYSGDLGNGGENLQLKDSSGNIIDTISAASGWPAGESTSKKTMERKTNGEWATSINVGGTPKNFNSVNSVSNNNSNSNTNNNSNPPTSSAPTMPTGPQPGEIIINEFVSDPSDGSEEWVELYNRTTRVIDLTGFALEDGSKAVTTLSGSLGTDSASRFLTIRSPKGNLNNDGDIIILKYNGVIIDQITYGKWNDGNLADNAPVTPDPFSIGRFPDGQDTNNDQTDFYILEPTLALPNKKSANPAPDSTTNAGVTIQFNEIYPNPPLSDERDEFIELINLSAQTIDINKWIISDEKSSYIITSSASLNTTLSPNAILWLPRTLTGLSLENYETEHLTLKSADGSIAQKISYKGPVREGTSYARDDNSWIWTTTPTPAKTNIINKLNEPPYLEFDIPKTTRVGELTVFDASDTIDPEDDNLNFTWSFGDGTNAFITTPSHIYTKAGRYTARLAVRDKAGNEVSDSQTITVVAETVAGYTSANTSGYLMLTEFLPNQKGKDNNEWLELYNPQNTPFSTNGWKIRIGNYNTILPNRLIPAESYSVFYQTDAKFIFPNNGTSVKLISPSGEDLTTVVYKTAPEDSSYARSEESWSWDTSPTPGLQNNDQLITNSRNEPLESTIDLKTIDTNEEITVLGKVAAPPGLFGKTIMFLAEPNIQVRLRGNNYPQLTIGDQIKITGKISQTTNGTILNAAISNLTNLGPSAPPAPVTEELSNISEDNEGQLITTSGTVSQSSASYLTLSDHENLKVLYKNKNFPWLKQPLGSQATITGFVVKSRSGIVLWARSPQDILATPATVNAKTIDLSTNKATSNWPGYTLISLLTLTLVGSYWWEKRQLGNPLDFAKKFFHRTPEIK